MARPFRFAVQSFKADSGKQWADRARRAEALGYSTLHLADHLLGPAVLAELEPPERAVDLVLGVLANAARVEQHRVGKGDVGRQLVALLAHRRHDQLAVEHVHLTADRFDEQLMVVRHCGASSRNVVCKKRILASNNYV